MRLPSSFIHRGIGQQSAIAAAIQAQEGYYPGSVAYSNNNPGNLIASSWTQSQPGYAGTSNGFAVFATPQDGENALNALISNYAAKGDTISQMMAAWAPAGQGSNNPTLYAQNVAAAAGVSPDTSVADALAGPGAPGTPDASDSTNPVSDALGLSQYGITDQALGIAAAAVAGIALFSVLA